jgi:hypothetical protein
MPKVKVEFRANYPTSGSNLRKRMVMSKCWCLQQANLLSYLYKRKGQKDKRVHHYSRVNNQKETTSLQTSYKAT